MKSLFALDAKIAASLHRFEISAPENPGLNDASLFAYSSISVLGSKVNGLR